ncbi:hypothetical protein [Salinimicrobium soli]|uniref:hypothetical protein n=1 Tax=Salinimicrobium soli TaxID=1254399 RepID=UPI003AAE5A03
MAQDIRKMFQEDKGFPEDKLKKGHQHRFEARLEKALPQEKKSGRNSFLFLKIAAVMVVALGISFFLLSPNNMFEGEQVVENTLEVENVTQEEVPVTKEYQLSDVSPEFKKIENFYLASLNIELAKLEVNDENRALVDSFMAQLAELDKEYKRLNAEIQESGLNESSVEAMISNLQLRLELLFKLKSKIKDINQSNTKNYENLKA